MNESVASALPWVAGAIGLFTYLAIASWAEARRKEREAYYRSEGIKKLAEMQGNMPDSMLQLLREALTPETNASHAKMMMLAPGEYRRERTMHYRNEMLRRLAAMPGATTETALEYIREEERKAEDRRREGLRLGGMITAAAGLASVLFLRAIVPEVPAYLFGLVPTFVGIALIVFAQMVGTGKRK